MKTISLKRMIAIVLLFVFVLTALASKGQLLTKVDSAKFETFSSPGKSTALICGDKLFVSVSKSDPFGSSPAYPTILVFNQHTMQLTDSLVYQNCVGCYETAIPAGAQLVKSGENLFVIYQAKINGQPDIGVIKTDLDGNFLQAKAFGLSGVSEFIAGVVATKDNGIAVVGDFVSTDSKGFFRKIKNDLTSSETGNVRLYKDHPRCIVQLANGSYILGMNDPGSLFDFASNYILKTKTNGDSSVILGYTPAYDRFGEGIATNAAKKAFVAGFSNYNTNKLGTIRGTASGITKIDSVPMEGQITQMITKNAGGYEFVGYGYGTITGFVQNNGNIVDSKMQLFFAPNAYTYSIVETDSGFIVISKESIYNPVTFAFTYNLIVEKLIYQTGLRESTPLESAIPQVKASIYPNPAHDQISVDQKFKHIEVFDLLGKFVTSYTNTTGLLYLNLQSGIYLVKLSNENEAETKKLVIR